MVAAAWWIRWTRRVDVLVVAKRGLNVAKPVQQWHMSVDSASSSRQALIWLTCQGVLAAIRVGYWTLDPSFDNSFANCGEYAMLSNTGSDHVTLTEIICATTGGSPVIILAWVLSYFTEHSMRDILRQACFETARDEPVPLQSSVHLFVYVDFRRILVRRGSL